MATNDALDKALTMLGAEYEREITDGLVDAWLETFGPVPDQVFAAAVSAWIRTEKRFPKASELLERCAAEPMVLEAEAAWRRVLEQCSVYTPESGTVWSARLVRDLVGEAAHRAVLEAGGYPQLELLGEAKTEFWARKRFVEAYRAQRAEGLPALPAAGARPALTEGRRGGELVHVTGRS